MSRTVKIHKLFNAAKFSQAVRRRRGGLTLRQAASETKMAASNLLRIERGETPEVETFLRLCAWMGNSPDIFSSTGAPAIPIPPLDTKDALIAMIRQDKSLPKPEKSALLVMVGLAYSAKEAAHE